MKKLAILLTAITAFTTMSATPNAEPEVIDYLLTDEGIVYVQNIRNGLNNKLVAKIDKGEKIKIDKGEVNAYRKNGREYRKMMYVKEGANCVSRTFLEKMYTRAGYTIYKRPNISREDLRLKDFFIFYGDQFELQLNEENHKTVLSFFFTIFNKKYMS